MLERPGQDCCEFKVSVHQCETVFQEKKHVGWRGQAVSVLAVQAAVFEPWTSRR